MTFTADPEMDGLMTNRCSNIFAMKSVQGNGKGFSKIQLMKAKEVQDFIVDQGFMSITNLRKCIQRGIWQNLPFTLKDVENSNFIYGKPIASLKGKSRKMAQAILPSSDTTEIYNRKVVTEVEVLMDFLYVNGMPFLLFLIPEVNYASVYYSSQGKGEKALWKLFQKYFYYLKAYGFVRSHT
jgi:hypothetical protein